MWEENRTECEGGSGDVAEPREREKALCSAQHRSLRCSLPMPFTCTHTHARSQCTETHRVREHAHTSLSAFLFFPRLNLQFFQPGSPTPIPFPTSMSGVRARRRAPTPADSSAGCGKCASPRGPYLSYATPCKSAAITQQQEQRQWRRRNFPPDGASRLFVLPSPPFGPRPPRH